MINHYAQLKEETYVFGSNLVKDIFDCQTAWCRFNCKRNQLFTLSMSRFCSATKFERKVHSRINLMNKKSRMLTVRQIFTTSPKYGPSWS